MEKYIIYLTLVITISLLILVIVLLKRKTKDSFKYDQNEDLKIKYELSEQLADKIRNYNKEVLEDLSKFEDKIYNNLEQKIDKINSKVEEKLSDGYSKTNKTFEDIIERIAKIDEAQKKIDALSTNIVSLQGILNDKKSRGTFGEVQLKQILSSVFGDNNKKFYELQKTLSNGYVVDACVYTPEPLGMLSIDSKFPLENYQRLMDTSLKENEKEAIKKTFSNDVKKHIDAIKNKYIVTGQTADEAIMFLPAEAVFAYITAYFPEIISYSQKNRVWITGPTTIMATLTTIQIILKNSERDEFAKEIQKELDKLSEEFKRYQDRWDKFKKSFESVNSQIKDISTTSEKIGRRFDDIKQVKLESNVESLN